MTSVVQPMDQGVIECMKKNYKKIFLRRMLFEDSRDSNAMIFFIKNWTLIDTIFTIASAWSNVPNKTLGKAWKNLMGEVLTMEEADSTSADLSTTLNTISNSDLHSISDIEQWMNDDADITTCNNVTDQDILDSVFHQKATNVNNNHIHAFYQLKLFIEYYTIL